MAGLVAFALLSILFSRRSYPPFPAALTIELTFPIGRAGKNEPILCTGMWGEGDILRVGYIDKSTAVLSYDHWGHGGPSSSPFDFQPGVRRTLRVEMPSFTTFQKPPPGARAPLRLVLDGQEILREMVPFHGRLPEQIYFGENAIGGTVAWEFRGTIRKVAGPALRGGPESYFTTFERLRVWLRTKRWEMVAVLLAGGGIGCVVGSLVGWWLALPRPPRQSHHYRPWMPVKTRSPLTPHLWFAGAAVACVLGYAWVVTAGSFNLVYPDVFANFYDYQAARLLQGRLDVPEEAIGGEAFEANGKLYGYFGPTSAVLRLPFVALGAGFGQLSRAFMVVYFSASLVAAYFILREAMRCVFSPLPGGTVEPTPFAIVILTASAGLGSTIFFLGSRTFVYHEAILAGITFALGSCWCALRHLRTPARRWWLGALIAGILSLHARPPTGLFALTLLGCVVVILAAREGPGRLRRHGSSPHCVSPGS